MRRLAHAATAALLISATSGCAFHGIDLVQDTRVALDQPRDGADVTLPFTVSWHLTERVAPGHQVSFAVFVDRAPIKPGQTLRAVVPDTDTNCKHDPSCPSVDYLARHDVYLVTGQSVQVPRLTLLGKRHESHRVIVVLLVDGKRDGEGAFSRTVYVDGRNR